MAIDYKPLARRDERDEGKRSKASVDYSLGGEFCGGCVHFINENEAEETGECELVAGEIYEEYWCKLFKRKRRGGNKNVVTALRHLRPR